MTCPCEHWETMHWQCALKDTVWMILAVLTLPALWLATVALTRAPMETRA